MSERSSVGQACEHYWAWVSPAGTRRWARICQICGDPDAAWLNHIIEVDISDTCAANPCVHCEFAEALTP